MKNSIISAVPAMKDVTEKREKLREAIHELTRPINGQYPRPWMAYGDPAEADVFIVGMNQRKAYKVGEVGEHHQFLDAHFNVHSPDCCRALYDKVSGGRPSPTRCNTDRIRACLEHVGAAKILETNVICYSSPMSEDLCRDGIERGIKIFRTVLDGIRPKVLVVHGAGATKTLGKTLRASLPSPVYNPKFALHRKSINVGWGMVDVLVIPSLAPPAWNRWCSQTDIAFPVIAQNVGEILRER